MSKKVIKIICHSRHIYRAAKSATKDLDFLHFQVKVELMRSSCRFQLDQRPNNSTSDEIIVCLSVEVIKLLQGQMPSVQPIHLLTGIQREPLLDLVNTMVQKVRNLPIGFECYLFYKERAVKITQGTILFRGTLKATFASLLRLSLYELTKLYEEKSDLRSLDNLKQSVDAYDLLKLSKSRMNIHSLSFFVQKASIYFVSILFAKAIKLSGRLKWFVCIIDRKSGKFSVLRKRGGYFADPFLLRIENVNYVFIEYFNFKEQKGEIWVGEVSQDGSLQNLKRALNEPFHLSFPFVFKHKSKIYMIPESSGNRSITLYESIGMPDKWKKKCNLVEDVSAVDSILWIKEEEMFLATSVDPFNGTNYSHRKVFRVIGLEEGHCLDVFESRPMEERARFAGPPLSQEDQIIVTNQFSTHVFYGRGIIVSTSDDKTFIGRKNELLQEFVGRWPVEGLHHLSSTEEFLAFDFSSRLPLPFLGKKISRYVDDIVSSLVD